MRLCTCPPTGVGADKLLPLMTRLIGFVSWTHKARGPQSYMTDSARVWAPQEGVCVSRGDVWNPTDQSGNPIDDQLVESYLIFP